MGRVSPLSHPSGKTVQRQSALYSANVVKVDFPVPWEASILRIFSNTPHQTHASLCLSEDQFWDTKWDFRDVQGLQSLSRNKFVRIFLGVDSEWWRLVLISPPIQVCTHLVTQVGPCFTMGYCPSEEAAAAAKDAGNRNISALAIHSWLMLWNWAFSRNAAQQVTTYFNLQTFLQPDFRYYNRSLRSFSCIVNPVQQSITHSYEGCLLCKVIVDVCIPPCRQLWIS